MTTLDGRSSKTYGEIIASVDDDATRIQALYEAQWSDMRDKYKAKLLDDNFEGMRPDPYLVKLIQNPEYEDPRKNLCVWARPSPAVKAMVLECQTQLQKLSPNIWLTPHDCLHATIFVVAQQISQEVLASIIPELEPTLRKAANFHQSHQTRLAKPRLSFDDTGVALSFVPSAGDIREDDSVDEGYTFMHLQRDLFELFRGHGVAMSTQKNPGSFYLSVARFVTDQDHRSGGAPDRTLIVSWVESIEKINEMLREKFWPKEGSAPDAGNWIVGGEIPLDIREGACWYGGGRSITFE
ncbi:hypothetical protein HJFPF1_13090 [Paramyrothecium foliicola]|nr:hypothetical protein HJFPF1_13090 [Paramyrothecium foliicola]